MGGLSYFWYNTNMEDLINSLIPSPHEDKITLFMEQGYGYSTASGVTFSKAQPYQRVSGQEALELMNTGRFRIASKNEVKEFYKL